jgi:hypothetical protein
MEASLTLTRGLAKSSRRRYNTAIPEKVEKCQIISNRAGRDNRCGDRHGREREEGISNEVVSGVRNRQVEGPK